MVDVGDGVEGGVEGLGQHRCLGTETMVMLKIDDHDRKDGHGSEALGKDDGGSESNKERPTSQAGRELAVELELRTERKRGRRQGGAIVMGMEGCGLGSGSRRGDAWPATQWGRWRRWAAGGRNSSGGLADGEDARATAMGKGEQQPTVWASRRRKGGRPALIVVEGGEERRRPWRMGRRASDSDKEEVWKGLERRGRRRRWPASRGRERGEKADGHGTFGDGRRAR